MTKEESLNSLYDEYSQCVRCPLANPLNRLRKNVVFGSGNLDARVLIVGESPSAIDEQNAELFSPTTASGEVIDTFLRTLGVHRDVVFITPVVSCRATASMYPYHPREPDKVEIGSCSARLNRIIEIIDPYVVLLLGPIALASVGGSKKSLGALLKGRTPTRLEIKTQGRVMATERIGFAAQSPENLLLNWNEAEGGPVHKSFLAWESAFKVAKMCETIYGGK